MRSLIPLVLAVWLVCATTAFAAQEDTQPTETDTSETSEPSGPALVATDPAPVACDPSAVRQRFLEVRGNGFDAFALQRLPGAVIDASGSARLSWSSIWVSPQGRLTLEIGLCTDAYRGRPALGPGTYTVLVRSATGAPIATTSFDLNAPPEATDTNDSEPGPDTAVPDEPPAPATGSDTTTGAD